MESPQQLESTHNSKNNLEQVASLLNKEFLDPSDISFLENWLVDHKEFGLEEMSDEEYYDFFRDGKFYVHSSAMFAGRLVGGGDKMRPMFLEALKDGYMLGGQILEERGKSKASGSVGEGAISFDNQDIFSEENPVPHHLKYTLEGPLDKFAPIVLVSPAKLLETHSNLIGGKAEGWYFGSDNDDPSDPSHELPLSLFVMLLPDIQMRSSFIKVVIQNLESDKKTAEIARSDELQNILKESSGKNINLRDFMETLIGLLSEKNISMPRLSFYQVNVRNLDKENDLEEIENGVKEFLTSHDIQPKTDTDGQEIHYQKVANAEKLEALANLVRKKLKSLQ